MKKHLLLMLALTTSITISAQDNLALGSTVLTDSPSGPKAIDGDDGTRWESAWQDDMTFQLDLGAAKDFNNIQLVWEGAYGKSFTIEAGNEVGADGYLVDGGIVVTSVVGQEISGFPYTQDIKFNKVNARYIKFHGTKRATGYGYSLWEFRVFDNAATLTDTQAPVLNTVEASAGVGYVTLNMQATDDQSGITYVITDAANSKTYTVMGDNAATTSFNIPNLDKAVSYTYSIVAKDANGNTSDSKTVTFTTLGEFKPAVSAPTPTPAAADVKSLFGEHYTSVAPDAYFNTWGSNGESFEPFEVATGDNTEKINSFGYLGFELSTVIDASATNYLHFDVYPESSFKIGITPITHTSTADNAENGKQYDVKANQWNSLDIPLTDFTTDKPELDIAQVFQLKWYGGENNIIYLDNVFFYKSTGTGISEVAGNGNKTSAKVYGIDGRHVGNDVKYLPKGLYIVNGRKVIVK